MDLQSVINSPGLWVASSIMVIIVLLQSIIYLKTAFTQAERLNMSRKQCYAGMRSAMITAIGPSLSPVIIALALIAVLGAPTAWMRMNDIGAARTELAMVTLATQVIGLTPQSPDFNLTGYAYALWGMALNNMGWMIVALVLTPGMTKYVAKLNTKYNPAWIKFLLSGATVGLFAFLLSNALVQVKSGALSLNPGTWCAAAVSAVSMLVISRAFAKHQRMQEVALGLSMLIGMFVTTVIFG
ncbi:membrane protein [Megasphaera cerevisiae DSM 20462]|jgi:hypothetical protein|uniref:Membrane protein n=1 Tax=Megasphaera cerevisiae DSM 20462 TaxID=1122219 RepID=A0A0J6WSS3_9FIRM|nr:DUF5058 family protein [Megasphaera cerevisiae]KMO85534.1 membrane protein [Megasphaera cerevisiae DSM 20462]SJZ74627.1 protein of unknown function [Megasphaera cerevisiae DSM 20462]